MKKVLKKKLFFINGCSKNFFLWEIPDGNRIFYEVIEEFRGHRISRAVLHGFYLRKEKALDAFKRLTSFEMSRVAANGMSFA